MNFQDCFTEYASLIEAQVFEFGFTLVMKHLAENNIWNNLQKYDTTVEIFAIIAIILITDNHKGDQSIWKKS